METLQNKIFNRIKEGNLKAFTTADFMNLSNYKGVSKALETLEDQNKIRRFTSIFIGLSFSSVI